MLHVSFCATEGGERSIHLRDRAHSSSLSPPRSPSKIEYFGNEKLRERWRVTVTALATLPFPIPRQPKPLLPSPELLGFLCVMVQPPDHGKLRQESAAGGAGKRKFFKLEVEEECDPVVYHSDQFTKRSKSFTGFAQLQWGLETNGAVLLQPEQFNPVTAPSPLGLRLRKSPSLLELIQMRLARDTTAKSSAEVSTAVEAVKKNDAKATPASRLPDKLKASNFPASLLKIGTWEYVSRYEGDLVAKCYFAKHKLVWEVLDNSLKSKIEIQWSDITALKAFCPENCSGTLDIVLARPPLFYKETNPQPRKHTLWQATSDFTGGEASIQRRHFLQCSSNLLSKHFEKITQCDSRLYSLSQQPDIVLDSLYFDSRRSFFDSQEETRGLTIDHRGGDSGSSFSFFHDSPGSAPSTSSRCDCRDSIGRTPDVSSRETPSSFSVTDESAKSEGEELGDLSHWDLCKVPGFRTSMSMSDLVNHIESCVSVQRTSGEPVLPGDSLADNDLLKQITEHLLSDSHLIASDENSLMPRVNSLLCLLQKEPTTASQTQGMNCGESKCNVKDAETDSSLESDLDAVTELKSPSVDVDNVDASESKRSPAISRKESFGELLLHHLPRIASMPFLFNISENTGSHDT